MSPSSSSLRNVDAGDLDRALEGIRLITTVK